MQTGHTYENDLELDSNGQSKVDIHSYYATQPAAFALPIGTTGKNIGYCVRPVAGNCGMALIYNVGFPTATKEWSMEKMSEYFHNHLNSDFWGLRNKVYADIPTQDALVLNKSMLMMTDNMRPPREGFDGMRSKINFMANHMGWEASQGAKNRNSGNEIRVFTWNKGENTLPWNGTKTLHCTILV